MSRLLQQIKKKLDELPERDLGKVFSFVESLGEPSGPQPQRGSPERLLQHAGSWSFGEKELDDILTGIDRMRETELER
ncbi:MAG: hypothetical protein HY720_24960 [Planctomycetes bacterium]|nr:hypothetical protein [Planctomycetota bacterium]